MSDELTNRADVEAALFGSAVNFAPIRHHSPACAWMLRAMIAEMQPEVILIEGPCDLDHHIPMLAEADTVPPVAIVAMGEVGNSGPRPVTYYPLSAHAPEFIAIQCGTAMGTDLRFMDLPSSVRMNHSTQCLQSEFPFTSADFVTLCCKRLGMRDGAELWDHLFETRLGQTNWRSFFCDVYTYCLALRSSTDPALMQADATLEREAEMRRHIASVGDKRTLVLSGGFHTPALFVDETQKKDKNDKGKKEKAKDEKIKNEKTRTGKTSKKTAVKPSSTESYLVAYGEDALDALSGYGAGLRYPGWYNKAWEAALAADGVPDWLALAVDTTVGFAGQMAGDDRRVPLPQLTEMAAIAQGLARMKGREAVMLPDLLDGMRTALIKTEAGPGEPFTTRMNAYLRGTRLGAVPKSAGVPPLVSDARYRAAKHRIDLSDSARKTRKLDIRRKLSHQRTQQYFYQMDLLNTGLASMNSGPDYLIGSRVDLLFAEWSVGWSPFVDGALIKAAPLGATVPQAAVNALMQEQGKLMLQGKGARLDALLTLVLTGLRAGLGSHLPSLIQDLAYAIGTSSDFDGLAQTVLRLQAVAMPDDPLHDPEAEDLLQVANIAFDRLIYLLADLVNTPEESLPSRIKSLQVIGGVLRGPQAERFNRRRFDDAVTTVLESADCPPLLAGAIMGLLVHAGLRADTELALLLKGTLGGIGITPAESAAALNGLLMTAPMLLWQSRTVLQGAEDVLALLDDESFLVVLPLLRLSLTQLNPHETDRLAEELVDLLQLSGGTLRQGSSRFSEDDLSRGLQIDRAMTALLKADRGEHESHAS